MFKYVWRGEIPYFHALIPFLLISKLAIGLFMAMIFILVCMKECTALPWLSLLAIGLINIALFMPIEIWLAVGAWRAANKFEKPLNHIAKAAIPILYFFAPGLDIGTMSEIYKNYLLN